MVRGPKLYDVLAALEKRGECAKATVLKQRVTERFKGVLAENALLELPVDDIVGTLDIFNQLFVEATKPRSILDNHVFQLKSQGFNIVYGAKYHE